MRFDHLGLVVADLDRGKGLLARLFHVEKWTRSFDDPLNKVKVRFGVDGSGMCYELVAPLGPDSPVAQTLATGRNVLNHVAYIVPDLATAAAELAAAGCVPLGEPTPAVAYAGCPIQFFITPARFIIEMIAAPDHHHDFMTTP